MKISSIVLAVLLFAAPCTALSFVPTMEDIEWLKNVESDSIVLSGDLRFIASAADIENMSYLIAGYILLAGDAKEALQKSQGYTVSPELEKAKELYEISLVLLQTGTEKGQRGWTEANADLIDESLKLMQEANYYTTLTNQALKEITT
jgi:hypothetical protein